MSSEDSVELQEFERDDDHVLGKGRESPRKIRSRQRELSLKPGSTNILKAAVLKSKFNRSESTEELDNSNLKRARGKNSSRNHGVDNRTFYKEDEVKSPGQGRESTRKQETLIDIHTEEALSDGSLSHTQKEDYLTIAIPEDEGQSQGQQNAPSTSFLGRWKKAAQNFIKLPSRSESVDEESAATIAGQGQTSPLHPVASKFLSSKEERLKQKKAELIEMKKPIEILTPTKAKLRSKAGAADPVQTPKSPDPSTSSLQSLSKRDRRRGELDGSLQKLFGITVHGSDFLPSDPNILHPLVRVSIMTQEGSYLIQGANSGASGDAGQNEAEQNTGKKPRRYNRKGELEPEDRQDGGKPKSRRSTSSGETTTLQRACLLPVMTQPYEFGQRLTAFSPTWNELLLFEEPFGRFIQPESDIIIFFEILDFLPMNLVLTKGRREYHGSEMGWYNIAWGFLKPVGANGVRNVNRKLRLQLFKPELLKKFKMESGPEVYYWWKVGKRIKLDSTLYVTLRGVLPPSSINTASIRTLLTMRKEHLTQAILESQVAQKKKRRKSSFPLSEKPNSTDIHIPQWSRLEGQSCKVPNKLSMSLPASQIASLNLTVSGNVHCVKFSPCGLLLATGLDTEDLHTVIIFEIPSGRLLMNLRGHHGLIYDIDWKAIPVTGKENCSPSYYLASASADSTVLVWYLQSPTTTPHLLKTLLHPSFVYCVKFHPANKLIVATGCFDYVIRLWSIASSSASTKTSGLLPLHENQSSPTALLDRHYSFVNCLTFNLDGRLLFSGDGIGSVVKWYCGGKHAQNGRQNWKVQKDTRVSESGKAAINNLVLHPGGNKLLVHLRDSCLKIMDIETFLVLHSFTGLANDKLQVRSCFSPCGNLVLSGSEDSTLCIWDADTSRILQFITPENHPNCRVTAVDYHPFEHMAVIGLSSSISEPSPILIYTYTAPQLPITAVAKLKTRIAKLQKPVNVQTTSSNSSTVVRDALLESIGSTDSTSKFRSIIRKLDEVKLAQRAKAQMPMSMASVTREVVRMRRQDAVDEHVHKGPQVSNKSPQHQQGNQESPTSSKRPKSERRRTKSVAEISNPVAGDRPASSNSVRGLSQSQGNMEHGTPLARERRRRLSNRSEVPERPLSAANEEIKHSKGRKSDTVAQPSPKPVPKQRRGSKELTKSASEDSPVKASPKRKSPRKSRLSRPNSAVQQESPPLEVAVSESNIGNTKRRERRERIMRTGAPEF